MRKTKIVCTVGPSTDDREILKNLMLSGMNVARFNFSHGDYETHKRRFEEIVSLREELGLHIATMLDTRGPEIRLGRFVDDKPVTLEDGAEYILTTEECLCDDKKGFITFDKLPMDVTRGTRILINDGLVEMIVEKVSGKEIFCKVIYGGVISNNKGINVPGVELSMPYLSDRDMEDLEFGAKMGFDFIAASFVRSSADINYLKKFIKSIGWTTPRIIAKIESMDGVDNIDEIIDAADGIMVARGDMGVEIPGEEVPVIQKMIIKKMYKAGKQVITATQMLDSMMKNPRPTRAEISDVANAIYDGTGAIMLSGETAAGKYPVEAVTMMSKIATRTEQDIDYKKRFNNMGSKEYATVREAISHATVMTAHDLNAEAIVSVTMSGSTARRVSKYRPASPILGCSVNEHVLRQLNLTWGVIPIKIEQKDDTFELFNHALEQAKNAGHLTDGDIAVITAGVPLGVEGSTNMIKVQKVDE